MAAMAAIERGQTVAASVFWQQGMCLAEEKTLTLL